MARWGNKACHTARKSKPEKRKRDEKHKGETHDGMCEGKQKKTMRKNSGGHGTIVVILYNYYMRIKKEMK